ncbi:MAG: DUF6445 family protein [Planctomycetes bacterium]|nr:DUF6445 family protein [Planctomycetota bacterium]
MWSSQLLQVNPRAKVTVERVGRDGHRVVLVDDFYAHPDEVVGLAQGLHFFSGKMHGNFPGARAIISLDTAPLLATLSELWGAPLEPFQVFQPVVFSAIVNHPGLVLNNAQRQPHVDPGVSAMVYLNAPDACVGGTGLYRHRLTGLERVPAAVTPALLRFAEQYGFGPESLRSPEQYTAFQDSIVFNPLFAAKDNTYINDGNEFWELTYLVEMRFNRLVIFDGRVPHSQHLKPGQFGDHARLNQIFYLKGPGEA